MREDICRRVLDIAEYMAGTGATVRHCAKLFGVSKTTVHKDMRKRLCFLNPALAERIDLVLDTNLRQRHLRGGEATKQKYARLHRQEL